MKTLDDSGLIPTLISESVDEASLDAELSEVEKTSFILVSNTMFLFKKTDHFWSLKIHNDNDFAPAERISCDLPLIPLKEMSQAIAFFKAVYKKHKSEAALVLYWDQKESFKWICPTQEVAAATVDYEIDYVPAEPWIPFLHMHSHASMTAFHSGTDDHDEEYIDGYNVTIGKLQQDDPEFECRYMIGGVAVKSTMSEIVEDWKLDDSFPKTWLKSVKAKKYPIIKPLYNSVKKKTLPHHSVMEFNEDPYDLLLDSGVNFL